jgi:hypothetical protein
VFGGEVGEQGVELVGGQDAEASVDDFGELGVCGWVGQEDAVADGAGEDPVQERVVLPYRPRGEAALDGVPHPGLDQGRKDRVERVGPEVGDQVVVQVGPVRRGGADFEVPAGPQGLFYVVGEADLAVLGSIQVLCLMARAAS